MHRVHNRLSLEKEKSKLIPVQTNVAIPAFPSPCSGFATMSVKPSFWAHRIQSSTARLEAWDFDMAKLRKWRAFAYKSQIWLLFILICHKNITKLQMQIVQLASLAFLLQKLLHS